MDPGRILVTYATNAGTTAEVAQAVAEELGRTGASVEVLRVEEVRSLEPYAAVVVGGPMIIGWHRAAARFIRRNRRALGRVPVAYFFTAMSLTRTDHTSVDGTPVCIDPSLAKAPGRADRLSFRESYSTVVRYLRPVLRAAPEVRPVSAGFFGGRLDLFRLKWWQRLFVLIVIQERPGDRRNWPAIREWAASLRAGRLCQMETTCDPAHPEEGRADG